MSYNKKRFRIDSDEKDSINDGSGSPSHSDKKRKLDNTNTEKNELLSLLNTYMDEKYLSYLIADFIGSGFFTTEWNIPKANFKLQLPIDTDFIIENNFIIDWGDNTTSVQITDNNIFETIHTYKNSGRYTITIKGDITGFSFKKFEEMRPYIMNIIEWGQIKLADGGKQFYNCKELECSATDVLNTSNLSNITDIFRGAVKFNGAIQNWDISGITRLTGMLVGANSFNQDLSNWNVTGKYMMGMLYGTSIDKLEHLPQGYIDEHIHILELVFTTLENRRGRNKNRYIPYRNSIVFAQALRISITNSIKANHLPYKQEIIDMILQDLLYSNQPEAIPSYLASISSNLDVNVSNIIKTVVRAIIN